MLKLSVALGALGLALLLFPLAPQFGTARTASAAARGQALFMAKGCAQCHHHAAVAGSGVFGDAYGSEGAPDLTNRPLDTQFLRTWLKDPAALRPNTNMPNLKLKEQEIEALIVFLQAGQGR